MRGLTDRQREVVEVIRRHLSTRGVPPTVRELGVELGGITPQAVMDLLRTLRRKGAVAWEPYASRTLRIVAPEVIASSVTVDPLIEEARGALRAFGLEHELDEVLEERGPGPYQIVDHPLISVLSNLAHDLEELRGGEP